MNILTLKLFVDDTNTDLGFEPETTAFPTWSSWSRPPAKLTNRIPSKSDFNSQLGASASTKNSDLLDGITIIGPGDRTQESKFY